MINKTKMTNVLIFSLLFLLGCSSNKKSLDKDSNIRHPNSLNSIKKSCDQIINKIARKRKKRIWLPEDLSDETLGDFRFFKKYVSLKNFKDMKENFWASYKNNNYIPRTLADNDDILKASIVHNGDLPDSALFTFLRGVNDNPYVPQAYNKPNIKSGNIDTVTTVSRIADERPVFTTAEKDALIAGEEWLTHIKGITNVELQDRLLNSKKVTLSELGHKRRLNAHLEQGFINTLAIKESKKNLKKKFPAVISMPKIVNGELVYVDIPFAQKSLYKNHLKALKYNKKRLLPQNGLMRIFRSSKVSKELLEHAYYYRRIELIEQAMRTVYHKGDLNEKQIIFYRKVVEFLNAEDYRPTRKMMTRVRVAETWKEFQAFYKFWQNKRIIHEPRFLIEGEPYEKATKWTEIQILGRAFLFYGTVSALVVNTMKKNPYYEYYNSVLSEKKNKTLESAGIMTTNLTACAESTQRGFHMTTQSVVHNYITSVSGSKYDEKRIDPTLDPNNDNEGEYDIERVYTGVRCYQIRDEFNKTEGYVETKKRERLIAAFHSHAVLFKIIKAQKGKKGIKIVEALKGYLEQKEIRKDEKLAALYLKRLEDLTDAKFISDFQTYRKNVQNTVQKFIIEGSFKPLVRDLQEYFEIIQDIENEKNDKK